MTGVARHTDPETSKAAAASVSEERITATQAEVLSAFEYHGPMTDQDLVYWWPFSKIPASDSSIRTRRHELTVKGLLIDTGAREKTASGRQAIVWGLASEVQRNG